MKVSCCATRRVMVALLFALAVTALTLVASCPSQADAGFGLFLMQGQTDLGFSWSVQLTQAPSVPLRAEGLLAGKSYGIGVATPAMTLAGPLLQALGLHLSEELEQVLAGVEVGGAVLTPDLKQFDVGLYARVMAVKVSF